MSEPIYNIFCAAKPFGTGPSRPPRVGVVVARDVLVINASRARWELVERQLLALLDREAAHGESLQSAFDRKERDLRIFVARLPRLERIALHENLGTIDNSVASRLGRMTPERRNRIVAFVAESARRKDVA